jgi:hypothetical protein
MSQPNRTSRRVVIGRLEQLDQRIALSGVIPVVTAHSGAIVVSYTAGTTPVVNLATPPPPARTYVLPHTPAGSPYYVK